ncbi:MAG TPA: hypothetical protein VHK90_15175, partial [Thermoanaerobaculia bacterium]|nr:hypothetical protein [Thermoanaerobaculia bacterium]
PWTLTLDERIALRTNPELARERVRAARAADGVRGAATNAQVREPADSFDGRSHPELFLPHEVFRSLISLAFQGPPRVNHNFRDSVQPELTRIGLPGDFWQKLESICLVHVADVAAEAEIGGSLATLSGGARTRAKQMLDLKQTDVCRSRADALAAARAEFGRERFDRFLYEVIAVHKFHVDDHPLNPAILRWVEGGCR